jgi:hypothetical protein
VSDSIVVGSQVLPGGAELGGPALRLDLMALLDTRMLIQANSGGGKSRLLRRMLEQSFGKVQAIVLDPEGEFSTLREKHDFLLVGSSGEIPAEPRSAVLLARRLVELRVSAVVDLYELKLADRRAFVRLFLDSLLTLPKDRYRMQSRAIVAIDEAHLFVPERSAGEAESTDAVIALMSQGRKRGLCGVLLTQRLSKMHKDAAAECNNVAIGRTWLDVDVKRASEVLGFDKAERGVLRELEPGEFLAFGPAFSAAGVTRFKGGDVLTTHPTAGQRHKLRAPAPSAAIQKVVGELRDLPAQADEEVRTLQQATAEVSRLKRELREAKKAAPAPVQVKAERVEVQVIKPREVARLEAAVQRARDAVALLIRKQSEHQERLAQRLQVVVSECDVLSTKLKNAGGTKDEVDRRPLPPKMRTLTVPERRTVQNAAPAFRSDRPPQTLGAGERATLIAIAQHPEGVTREQLSVLTGYKKSTRNTYLQRLGAAGQIVEQGDRIVASDEGVHTLGDSYETLPTGDELRAHWLQKLPEGERRVLEVVVAAHPKPVEREAIGEATGYTKSSRNTYLQRLGARRLVTARGGQIVAASELFG